MAGVGLAIPIAARYIDDGNGNISYQNGLRFAKAVEFSTEFGDNKANNLYADNGIAETQNMFSGGTLTLTTDDLDNEASKLILGITEKEITYNGKKVSVLVNKADDVSPYLGFGVTIKRQKDGKAIHTAVILPKVSFSVPADSATTQGESIEWKTPSLSGTIMRDDTPEHNWKYRADFQTEAAAVEFIKWFLKMLPASLTITSEPGTIKGTTQLTVSPVKGGESIYKYLLGIEVYTPDKGSETTESYQDWDGLSEIEAEQGQKILLVEVDSDGKIQRAGIAELQVAEEDAPTEGEEIVVTRTVAKRGK